MRLFAALMVVAALSAVEAHAQTPEIEHPVWIERPDPEAFRQSYPSQAAEQAVEGRATIECLVQLDTSTSCRVIAESPASWGFGDAALTISRTFRVEPARVDGQPVPDGRIRTTIRFIAPAQQETYEGLTPEQREWAEAFAPLDLPNWEDAPPAASVVAATPPAARDANLQGRGVLSCRVNRDRHLRCRPHREMPANSGFGAAAMQLAPQFVVAESSQEFADAHRIRPFFLPIVFNGPPEVTPVSRFYAGLAPLELPVIVAPQYAIPPAALSAQISGTASVLCNLGEGLVLACALETESPRGYGFGEVLVSVANNGERPPPSPNSGLIPGDQIRIRAAFAPN